jgi:8-oxo-dGTP diphosphatase
MAQKPIFGAGGIVVRSGDEPLIAIVQRRKDNEWVLPKGKLKRHESAIAAAEREVMEETGQEVIVGEFLGAVSYRAARRPKVVQFWRMQACDHPARKPAKDIKAAKWLPLEAAIRKLTDPLEQVFLQNVAERILAAPMADRASAEHKQPTPPEQPTALSSSIDERPNAAEAVREELATTQRVPADSSLVPDQDRSRPSAVGHPPRPILGGRPVPPPVATKPTSTEPVARLNWLNRILHRLWRDRINLS